MIDNSKLINYFGNITFQKGFKYYMQGKVLDEMAVTTNSDITTISAHVEGNYWYDCKIKLKGDKIISTSCTCPVRKNCKHTAAVSIYYFNQYEEKEEDKEEIEIKDLSNFDEASDYINNSTSKIKMINYLLGKYPDLIKNHFNELYNLLLKIKLDFLERSYLNSLVRTSLKVLTPSDCYKLFKIFIHAFNYNVHTEEGQVLRIIKNTIPNESLYIYYAVLLSLPEIELHFIVLTENVLKVLIDNSAYSSIFLYMLLKKRFVYDLPNPYNNIINFLIGKEELEPFELLDDNRVNILEAFYQYDASVINEICKKNKTKIIIPSTKENIIKFPYPFIKNNHQSAIYVISRELDYCLDSFYHNNDDSKKCLEALCIIEPKLIKQYIDTNYRAIVYHLMYEYQIKDNNVELLDITKQTPFHVKDIYTQPRRNYYFILVYLKDNYGADLYAYNEIYSCQIRLDKDYNLLAIYHQVCKQHLLH